MGMFFQQVFVEQQMALKVDGTLKADGAERDSRRGACSRTERVREPDSVEVMMERDGIGRGNGTPVKERVESARGLVSGSA